MNIYQSNSTKTTKEIAKNLAAQVKPGAIICLYGDLGAGKTVFTKGFADHFKIPENEIKSPTYTFVRTYRKNGVSLYHFDFYRILEDDDMISHELETHFKDKKGYFIIEWPSRIAEILKNRKIIKVELIYIDSKNRQIKIHNENN
jgi:tRNA threonylcarbamoyladenosine biosynthesis protein TsaE